MKLTARCVTLVTVMSLARGQGDFCTSSSGVSGRCVTLNACDKLKSVIWSSSLSQEVFKQWQCGFEERKPMVCCPINTIVAPESKNVTPGNAIDRVITTTVITITTATTATGSTTSTTTTTTTTSAASPSANKCVTVEGNFGTCVKLSSCRNLADKLKNPTDENLDYVFKSRCHGVDPHSVCCEVRQLTPKNSKIVNGDAAIECNRSQSLPDPSGNCCGIESAVDKKTNEGQASIYQYPWLAMLEYKEKRNKCIGSLISSRYVLTAGLCVFESSNKLLSIRLGDYNVTNNGPDCVENGAGGKDCNLGAVSIAVAATIVHPDYNKGNIPLANDIALIKLSELAPYNEFIRPICLPKSDITKSSSDLRFFVAGWGAVDEERRLSEIKLHTDLPHYDDTRCRKIFVKDGVPYIWDKQLCAGGELNVGSCTGDAGGPLMHYDGTKFEITGITSYGFVMCGGENEPNVYTKVYKYIPWIESVVMT